MKRREIPTSISHLSVGTEDSIKERREKEKSLQTLALSRQLLEPLIHPIDELKTWGYIVEIPEGEGSREPHIEGQVTKCERCAKPFQVKRMDNADKCQYRWGKPLSTRANGMSSFLFAVIMD